MYFRGYPVHDSISLFYLLAKKQVNSPNLGVMGEQRGAVASTIPVKRLINNGAP